MAAQTAASEEEEAQHMTALAREMGMNEAQIDTMIQDTRRMAIGDAHAEGVGGVVPIPEAVGANQCAFANCTKAGTKKCSKCNITRYCGKECQQKDWRAGHKKVCAQLAQGNVQTSASSSAAAMWGNMTAGTSGVWHSGVKRKRVWQRLVLSFGLRVEDEYAFAGQFVGIMKAASEGAYPRAGDRDNPVLDEFRRYLEHAKRKGVLPVDWSDEDERKVIDMAVGKEWSVYVSWEKSDIVKEFGYASGEHSVLRSLAEAILGPIGNWV